MALSGQACITDWCRYVICRVRPVRAVDKLYVLVGAGIGLSGDGRARNG
jgi:hypothetical protein